MFVRARWIWSLVRVEALRVARLSFELMDANEMACSETAREGVVCDYVAGCGEDHESVREVKGCGFH